MLTLRKMGFAVATAMLLAACNQGGGAPENKAASAAPAGASGAATAPAAGGELVVKLGTANPLTGAFAEWGKDAANGVKLAVDEANAENLTWNGQKVKFELMSEDDMADPKTAAQVADRFVDAKVSAVIGHLVTGASLPASIVYNDHNIPMVAYSVTGPKFTQQGFKGVFRVISNDKQQGDALGAYAVKTLGAKTFAVIHDKTAYGEGLANDFAAAAEAAGAKKVATEFTSTSATEFGAIVTAMKGAAPDLIFYGGMDPQGAPLLKELRKQGVKAKYMGADGLKTSNFPTLAGDAAEGAFASTASVADDKMPGRTAFAEKYKKAFGGEVVAYSPYAYDATNVVLAAMKKAQSSDPAKYLPELAASQFDGITGKIGFTETGDLKDGVVTIYTIKGGKWEVAQ